MHLFKWRSLTMAVLGMAGAGCTLMPGLNLSARDVPSQKHYSVAKSTDDSSYIVVDANNNPGIQVVEISPDLIQQERTHADQAQRLPEGLVPITGSGRIPEYQIGAGDVLTVTVWEHPELTNPAGG